MTQKKSSDNKKKKKELTVDSISEMLNNSGYVCDKALAQKVVLALNTQPVGGAFLYGPAGCGKSELPQKLASILNMETVFFQTSPGTKEDDLVVKIMPDNSGISGMSTYPGPITEAAQASRNSNKKTMLILDEWDKTRPSADAFLLDFLQNGRIWHGNIRERANLDNLFVFITMNDERDLSEPLLRRLSMINFNNLPVPLVRKALNMTHKNNPFIENAVLLYKKCLVSGMEKPVTIQEMRQFLDAIRFSGKNADWNELVFQFITKTRENHTLLKKAENKSVDQIKDESPDKLSSSSFNLSEEQKAKLESEAIEEDLKNGEVEIDCNMPSVTELIFEKPEEAFPAGDEEVDLSSYGVVNFTPESYSEFVRVADAPGEDQKHISDIASVVEGKYVQVNKPVPLSTYRKYHDMFNCKEAKGEVYFRCPDITVDDIKALQKRGLVIVSYTKNQILGHYGRVYVRWTQRDGLDVIVNLREQSRFEKLFTEYKSTDDIGLLRSTEVELGNGEEYADLAYALIGADYHGIGKAYRKGLREKFYNVGHIVLRTDPSIRNSAGDLEKIEQLEAPERILEVNNRHFYDYKTHMYMPITELNKGFIILKDSKKTVGDDLLEGTKGLFIRGEVNDIDYKKLYDYYKVTGSDKGKQLEYTATNMDGTQEIATILQLKSDFIINVAVEFPTGKTGQEKIDMVKEYITKIKSFMKDIKK